MHRLNRIGLSKIGNLEKASLTSAITDFATEEYDWNLFKVNSIRQANGIDFASDHIVFTDTGIHISSGKAVGLGIQVSSDKYEKDFVYGVQGNLAFNCGDPDTDVFAIPHLGLLDAAAVALGSAPVNVANPIAIPFNVASIGRSIKQYSFQNQIVTERESLNSPITTTHGVCLFWKIVNAAGVDRVVSHMHLDLSLWRYREDFDNWDPPRL